jgi:hypothetical protein
MYMRGGWKRWGLLAFLASPAFGAVMLGQVDDFQDGTLQGWTSGANNPNPPLWVPGAGPFGFDDAYMVTTSSGESGPGGQLVVFNDDQWTGNYLAAGVTAIQMRVQNFSQVPVELSLRVEGPGGVFNSISPVSIGINQFWQMITLDISPASLTGGADVFATLSNVTRLRIQDARGPLLSSVGFDKITAIPEPASVALLLAGAIPMVVRRRG